MKEGKKKFQEDFNIEIERDDKGGHQEIYQNKIPPIFNISNPKKRLYQLRRIKEWIKEDRLGKKVRDSWADEWINLIESEIAKAIKEKYKSNSLSIDDIYSNILNANEGILAGKMAFFQFIQNEGNFRIKPDAFNKADEIYRSLKNQHFYKDFKSFESSQSQFFEKPNAQATIGKILKRLK